MTTHTIESSTRTIQQNVIIIHILRHHASYLVIMHHPTSLTTSLHLDHQFGPTLTYPSTTRDLDDTAGVITLRLGRSPTTGDGASPLVANGFRGRIVAVATISG